LHRAGIPGNIGVTIVAGEDEMPKAAAKAKTAKRTTATKTKSPRRTKPASRAKAKSAGMSSARIAKARVTAKAARVARPGRKAEAKRETRGAVSRRAASARKVAPPQKFKVSHLDSSEFKRDGLRSYAAYRDLGMAEATNGMVVAQVIRMLPPCTDEVRKRHYHDVQLQLVYLLKGWMRNEFEGEGEQLMKEGSCWIQPAKIRHTVLDYSDDCEVLEIVMPANFATAEV
jgi:hypothetical protein